MVALETVALERRASLRLMTSKPLEFEKLIDRQHGELGVEGEALEAVENILRLATFTEFTMDEIIRHVETKLNDQQL